MSTDLQILVTDGTIRDVLTVDFVPMFVGLSVAPDARLVLIKP